MARLSELALRTGRFVGPHISMLLASLEGAGLLTTEAEAQVSRCGGTFWVSEIGGCRLSWPARLPGLQVWLLFALSQA